MAALEERAAASDFYTQPFEQVAPILEELEAAKTSLELALERWMDLEEQNAAADRGWTGRHQRFRLSAALTDSAPTRIDGVLGAVLFWKSPDFSI